MSFLNLFNKAGGQEGPIKAYKTEQANTIYNLLFCDDLKLYKDNFKGEAVFPWSGLFSGSQRREDLEKIANEPGHESRVRILAYNELIRLGSKSSRKELLGVIVEVGLDNGLDTLAAYADRTARYINHSEKMIIWEKSEEAAINDKIMELFQKSGELVLKIGPWNKKRLPQPIRGEARISFLVSDGLYFGQGKFESLIKDPLGGKVLKTSSELMNLLINKSLNKLG